MFQEIATAYETLRDDETRADYNYYLDHPEQRAYNYYQYYRRRVAPKVDPRIVILVTIILISTFQFFSAAQKYREALDYAVKNGKYRNAAKKIAEERGLLPDGGLRRDKKSRKEHTEQILRQIIEENVDIRWIMWNYSWFIKYYVKKEDYDNEAKIYLIRRNMGLSEEQFASLDVSERASFFAHELWDRREFEEWKALKEEQQKEIQATSARYKRYRRFMKNQTGSTISFAE
ncbi:unnamed protein product [Gongylonema pulchrum]|uniref:J domain-containing protein n=1 Tax=Gongylonema pulchrum TaxID=637853 RepID=A0A183EGB2_9BILA|nr:unnamed protein product [Gongylonema pulchrum]